MGEPSCGTSGSMSRHRTSSCGSWPVICHVTAAFSRVTRPAAVENWGNFTRHPSCSLPRSPAFAAAHDAGATYAGGKRGTAMKRTKRLVKQPLQLSRDTIRNLEVADLRHAAGGSARSEERRVG